MRMTLLFGCSTPFTRLKKGAIFFSSPFFFLASALSAFALPSEELQPDDRYRRVLHVKKLYYISIVSLDRQTHPIRVLQAHKMRKERAEEISRLSLLAYLPPRTVLLCQVCSRLLLVLSGRYKQARVYPRHHGSSKSKSRRRRQS